MTGIDVAMADPMTQAEWEEQFIRELAAEMGIDENRARAFYGWKLRAPQPVVAFADGTYLWDTGEIR